jgi:hypothetical protein
MRHKTSPASALGTGTSRIAKVSAAVNKQAFMAFGIIEYPFMICSSLPPYPLEKKGTEGNIILLGFHPKTPSPKTLTALPSAL